MKILSSRRRDGGVDGGWWNVTLQHIHFRLIAARRLYKVLNRGTRYQQVINPYSAGGHSQHPEIE